METNLEEKRKLLEMALEHRNEAIRITDQRYPFVYWTRGLHLNYLAELKSEMSNLEEDSEVKKRILEGAASDKERGLQLCSKEIQFWEKIDTSLFPTFARFEYEYGELLSRLYGLTNSDERQMKALKAFEEAAESFQKLNMVSRVAECYWKAARVYDALGESLDAAESFNSASDNYAKAAEKIPQFRDFYQDHTLYMQAWSEIERARHHHSRQEYGLAEEHYEKAATLHKSLKQ
jgi:tetratricopeptide (TPR) repeat protein